MKKTKIILLLLILKQNLTYQSEVNLLNLKNHWDGHGVGVLYPKTLRLLTSKTLKQTSLFSTFNRIPGGDNWEIKLKINHNCKKNEIGRDDNGFVIWLPKNKIYVDTENFTFDKYHELFGMVNYFKGLMVLYYKNNLYVAFFDHKEDVILTRDDILDGAKICKIRKDDENNILLKIRYKDNTLGIYSNDVEGREDDLCIQYPDLIDFKMFNLSVSASDWQSFCDVKIKQMDLFSSMKIMFKDSEDKLPIDKSFAYFSENDRKISGHRERYDNFRKYIESNMVTAKILSKKLLEFADKNEKELMNDIRDTFARNIDTVDKALEIISIESQMLQNLGTNLVEDKKKFKGDMEEVFDSLMGWFKQVDDSYNKVEEQTKLLYESVININIEKSFSEIVSHSDKILKNVDNVLNKIKKLKEKSGNKKAGGMNLVRHWKKELKRIKKKHSIKRLERKMLSFKNFGMLIIGFVGMVVLGTFGCILCKIIMASRHKRIL